MFILSLLRRFSNNALKHESLENHAQESRFFLFAFFVGNRFDVLNTRMFLYLNQKLFLIIYTSQ